MYGFDSLFKGFLCLLILAVIFVPLGVWKAVELISHIHIAIS